jgi:hypothetical protein
MSFVPSGMGAAYCAEAVVALHHLQLTMIARGELVLTMDPQADPDRFFAAVEARTRQLLAEERSEKSGLLLRGPAVTAPKPEPTPLPARPAIQPQRVAVSLVGVLIPGPSRFNLGRPDPAGVELVTRLAEEGYEVTLVAPHDRRQVQVWLGRWKIQWAIEAIALDCPAKAFVVNENLWSAIGSAGVLEVLSSSREAA